MHIDKDYICEENLTTNAHLRKNKLMDSESENETKQKENKLHDFQFYR